TQVVAVSGSHASPLDASITNSFTNDGSTSTRSTGTITPSVGDELFVAFYGINGLGESVGPPPPFSIDSGFTIQEETASVNNTYHGGALATFAQRGATPL